MSGIAAIYNRVDPGPDPRLLGQFVEQLAWRGPDQSGTWYDDHAGLCATQFWTTPEDWGSQQPVASRDATRVLVFDGRLDNRPELVAALRLAAEGAATSDAEIVLAAYDRWGEAFPQELAGPFSVAVWDRNHHRLVCARDPLGQRPFYYRLTAGHLYAASTIAALRQAPGTVTLNDDYIWDFLCTGGRTGSFVLEETPFREIRRLPPGHVMVIGRSGLRTRRYWEPWRLPPLRYRDDREYADHFREVFTGVVRAHSRAAGPVCATLSGGLDSSSIVCALREVEQAGEMPGALETLTLTWKDAAGPKEGYDERRYVEEVVARYPGPAHYLPAGRLHGFDFFSDAALPHDEPFTLFGQRLWSVLTEKARELGSRVLVAGSGGDHLLTGNCFYLTDLLRAGAFRGVARGLRDESRRRGVPYPALVAGYLLAPQLPRHAGAGLLRALTSETDRRRIDRFYYWRAPDWLPNHSDLLERGRRRHKLLRRRFSSLAAQMDYEQIEAGSQDHVRLPLCNVALAGGVDLRNPFFDHRVATLCLRLPPHLKYREGVTKVALRLAFRDMLPPALVRRPDKTGYNFALTEHVKKNWALVQDIYEDAETQRRGYVDAQVLLGVIAQLQQGGSGAMELPSALAALGLEDWLRRIDLPRNRKVASLSRG